MHYVKPFGEDRYTSGSTPTGFRFTGQRWEDSIKLYYYGARWYDSSLGRWAQPDSIVSNHRNPLDFDRFSYVRNNPVRLTDPTGHEVCDEDGNCINQNKYRKINGQTTVDWWAMVFGIKFTGEEWSGVNQRVVINAVRAVGSRFSSYLENSSSWQAFRTVYGNTFTFKWSNQTPGNAGYCNAYNSITLYKVKDSPQYLRDHSRVVVHELGHAFSKVTGGAAKDSIPASLLRGADGVHSEVPGQYYGFAGGWDDWQYGWDNSRSEVFADMFVGWTYNSWDMSHPANLGVQRQDHMDVVMSDWFNP